MKIKLLFVIAAVLLCQLSHAQNVLAAPYSIEEQVKIFPNPATTFLSVELTTSADYTITITNMLGAQVIKPYKVNASERTILDISFFTDGVYIVR
jgi:hypothetical protein